MKIHVITSQDLGTGRSTSAFVKGQLAINCGFEQGMGKAPFVIRLQNTDRQGNSYTERDQVLINLEFAGDGNTFWSGTFADLQAALKPAVSDKSFPNGFASWMETHHEIVTHLARTVDFSGSAAHYASEQGGTGRLWELGEELTDLFENKYKDFFFDGEFYDYIEEFLQAADAEAAKNERGAI